MRALRRHAGGKRRLQAAGALIVVAGGVLGFSEPAPAAVSSFEGSAAAAGVRVLLFADKGIATKTPIDGGGPVAQAFLDSLGTSGALASNPFPGDLVLSGPGLLAGAFGIPSLPASYPFVARADYPVSPEQSASTPFGELKASAQPQAAKASSAGGGGSGGFSLGRNVSAAGVRVDGETVVAESQSVVRGLEIGELHIGGVVSSAKVVLQSDGTLKRTATVSYDQATVAGQPVVFTAHGVAPAGPAPAAAGLSPAEKLGDSGIEVVQLDKEETADGVVSGGLQITKSGDFGPAGPGYIRIVLGQASARARGEGTVLLEPQHPASGGVGTAAEPGVTAPSLSPPPSESVPAPASVPVAAAPFIEHSERIAAGYESPATSAPPSDSSVTEVALATSASPAGSRAGGAITAPRAGLAVGDSIRLNTAPLYALIFAGAALGGAAIQLIRFFAER